MIIFMEMYNTQHSALFFLIYMILNSWIIFSDTHQECENLVNGAFIFLSFVGNMDACLVSEVADGSSNVREVWKLSVK